MVICRWLNHTAGISLSWSHRCTEDNLVWVLSRAENIPSPPCPRQVGDPARSHQGKPPPWARLLRESRGKLFDFYSASFSFTEDTNYKKTSTIASHRIPHACPAKPLYKVCTYTLKNKFPFWKSHLPTVPVLKTPAVLALYISEKLEE